MLRPQVPVCFGFTIASEDILGTTIVVAAAVCGGPQHIAAFSDKIIALCPIYGVFYSYSMRTLA